MPELLLEEVGLKRLDGKIPELLLELNLHKGKITKKGLKLYHDCTQTLSKLS